MSDIVERLQAANEWMRAPDWNEDLELVSWLNRRPAGGFQAAINDITRLTAENEKLRAALQWQPIETAPKDGTEIIVYRPDAGVFGAFYSDECWFCTYSGEDFSLEPPTHWMHLPPPPALKENNDG